MGIIGYLTPMDAAAVRQLRAWAAGFNHGADTTNQQKSADLDKAWHLLHFTLCGEVEPNDQILSQAILGGEEIGEDVGVGPLRLIAPDTVRLIAVELQEITVQQFITLMHSRDWTAADDIYGVRVGDDIEEFVPYVAEKYADMRHVYLDTAKRGDAMLAYLI